MDGWMDGWMDGMDLEPQLLDHLAAPIHDVHVHVHVCMCMCMCANHVGIPGNSWEVPTPPRGIYLHQLKRSWEFPRFLETEIPGIPNPGLPGSFPTKTTTTRNPMNA